MGTLALAAKISHDPVLAASEGQGPLRGSRQAAIEGLVAIGQRCAELQVDTLVVLDAAWRVLSERHINAASRFDGRCTSPELPQLVQGLEVRRQGHPRLAEVLAEGAEDHGIAVRAHGDGVMGLGWGVALPLRYLDPDGRMRVVAVAAGCEWHDLHESARFGRALREAIESRGDATVALLASGSLSHRFAPDGRLLAFAHRVWNPMLEAIDHEIVDLWEQGRWKDFCDMLPVVSETCFGEGRMHDMAMLMGALGWDACQGRAEVVTPCWGSCGTGQVHALLPVGPLPAVWPGAAP